MAVKLGALLLESGAVSPAQLEEALQAQVMFGGRLGTNLIELGFISGEFLAQLLSKQLRIPFCSPQELQNIPPEVIKLLPKEIIVKHRAVPVRQQNKQLWVAMVDPTVLSAIDEMSFATNLKISAMIAPEMQVVEAMERYYKIAKEQRYVELGASGNAKMALTHSTREFIDEAGVGAKVPEGGAGPKSFVANLNYPEPAQAQAPAAPLRLEPLAAATPVAVPPPPPPPVAVEQIAASLAALEEEQAADSMFPLNDIAEVLTEARSKEDIFQAIISPFMEFFERYALFINKNEIMVGHDGFGSHLSKSLVETVAVPLQVPSIFRDAAQKKGPIFGMLPESHNNARIATMLERNGDHGPCLICPIPLVEKIGVIVYADFCKDPQAVQARLSKFQKLMAKAGLAFQVLVLKQKILHL